MRIIDYLLGGYSMFPDLQTFLLITGWLPLVGVPELCRKHSAMINIKGRSPFFIANEDFFSFKPCTALRFLDSPGDRIWQ